MRQVAIAIVCKTPAAGQSKTRLSPPLTPQECAELSACFIRDTAANVRVLIDAGEVDGYAVYTPRGTETEMRTFFADPFHLLPQGEGDLGVRMLKAIRDLLSAGHAGVVLIGADAPTLPNTILHQAVDAARQGDNLAISHARDGGYVLIGVSRPHARLFNDIPWSTDAVYRLTCERARDIGLPVVALPGWYDVDDAATFHMLENELAGGENGHAAPATRAFLRGRLARSPEV